MSEYQYYEWQTVDRLLTNEEKEAVENLSSHIEVNSSSAVVTYDWSDFRHDPKQVLLKYFDAFFYFANWGSLQLMFRFPKGLIEEGDIFPYCMDEIISFEPIGKYQILDLDFSSEDGESLKYEASLADFIHLRADILEGDYRLLYLAWLKSESRWEYPDFDEEPEDDDSKIAKYIREPPVPAGLKKLTPSLKNFVRVFGINPFLVQAAAEKSPDIHKPQTLDYRDLIGRLTQVERDDFLLRLAEGEPNVGIALRKHLSLFMPSENPQRSKPRTIKQLIKRAKQLEGAAKSRQLEFDRKRHINEMRELAKREEQAWQQVETLLDNGRRIASVYDWATSMLEQLKQLSEFQNTQAVFQGRLNQLAEKYASRPALIERWKRQHWL